MKRTTFLMVAVLAFLFVFTSSLMAAEKYYTRTFIPGTVAIPMDEKQADKMKAFGLVHTLLGQGVPVYRIVAAPDPVLVTDLANLAGDTFFGGPFLVEAPMPSWPAGFDSVTTFSLAKSFTSERVYALLKASRILVVPGIWGNTATLLDLMGISGYSTSTTSALESDPSLISNTKYDVIVIDCPGWGGFIPAEVVTAMQGFVGMGGELIFNDIAQIDLMIAFPGFVTLKFGSAQTLNFRFTPQNDFISQFHDAQGLVAVETHPGGVIATQVAQTVKTLLTADNYRLQSGQIGPAVAAYYFAIGDGYVQGYSYHPQEEGIEVPTATFYGNKLIHLPPPPEVPPQQSAEGRMTGGGTICEPYPAKKSTKGSVSCHTPKCAKETRHGFELHCDAEELPNRLEINWGNGNKFHLLSLDGVRCYDDPSIGPEMPAAGFDTMIGSGTGRYNGVGGATVEFTLTDAGEPGSKDFASVLIRDRRGRVVLDTSGNLKNGNQQAHSE